MVIILFNRLAIGTDLFENAIFEETQRAVCSSLLELIRRFYQATEPNDHSIIQLIFSFGKETLQENDGLIENFPGDFHLSRVLSN